MVDISLSRSRRELLFALELDELELDELELELLDELLLELELEVELERPERSEFLLELELELELLLELELELELEFLMPHEPLSAAWAYEGVGSILYPSVCQCHWCARVWWFQQFHLNLQS